MPRNKKSKNHTEQNSTSRSSSAAPSTRGGNRESMFTAFSSGLATAAATSSPPAAENLRTHEFKNVIMSQVEGERSISVQFINSVFAKIEKDLGKGKDTVYSSASLGERLSFVEAVAKVIEDKNRSDAVSRKVTWNSNNSENMPPPSEFRRPRRSRSCDARPTHNTMLSHRPRQAVSTDRLMKTPSTTFTRPYNVATVTPHPQFTGSRSNMTILRKPNPGEMAISMGGSPLCVNGENNSAPSVTVPLSDGRVFQVLGSSSPSSPFQEEMRRGLDDETRKRLGELKTFIDKLV